MSNNNNKKNNNNNFRHLLDRFTMQPKKES